MPTVLQVLPALDSGGVERGTVEIVAALAADGWTPLVASAGGPLVHSVLRAGGRHFTLPLQAKDPLTIWRNAARLEALIRAENVSLVHAASERSRGHRPKSPTTCRLGSRTARLTAF